MGSRLRVLVVLATACGCGGGDGETEVRIIRGDPATSAWLDLTVEGVDFAVPDGTRVVLEIGMPDRPPERLGYAELRVASHGFKVTFPAVWESSTYKKKLIFIDADGNGACGAGEQVLVDWSAGLEARTMYPGDFFPADCAQFVADWPAE